MTDLVGSTELNVKVGDDRYLGLLREHNAIIRRRLREFEGSEFKHTGDGVCAWFSSAKLAVRCALAVQADLQRTNHEHPELPLDVRCGLAAGEPLAEGDDLFGLAVVRASRVCAVAGAGDVLMSAEVAALCTPGDLSVKRRGAVSLKGLPDRVTLYEAGERVIK